MGGTSLGDMYVSFSSEISGLTSGIQEATKQVSGFESMVQSKASGLSNAFSGIMGEIGKFASGAVALATDGAEHAFGFLKDQLFDSIQIAAAHEQIMTQTTQAIKSTGDASGWSALQINKYAEQLSNVTPFSEDAVQGGENLLLTFTNIGQKTFPQATQAILDISQAMGQDLKSSAIQVGKALNDPITGMSALQRIGVTFSASEKEQIKTMMAHNDIIGAQGVMLKELNTEFGGSAKAAGTTFAGALQVLGNQFDNIKEQVGTAFLPVLSGMVKFIQTNIVPPLDTFALWFSKTAGPALKTFAGIVSNDVSSAFHTVSQIVGQVVQGLQSPEFAGFATTLRNFFEPAVRLAGQTLQNIFQPAINGLSSGKLSDISTDMRIAAQSATVFVEGLQGFSDGSSGFAQAGVGVHDTVMQIGADIQTAWGYMVQVGTYLQQTFTPTWVQMQQTFAYQVEPAWQDLTRSFGNMPGLLDMVKGLGEGVVIYFAIMAKGIAAAATDVTIAFGGIIQVLSGIATFTAGWGTAYHDLITGNFSRIAADMGSVWTGIINIVRGALNIIDGLTGGMFSNMLSLFGTSMPKLTASWTGGTDSIKKSTADMKSNVNSSFSGMKDTSLNTIQIFTDSATTMLGKMGKDGASIMQQLDQSTISYWNDIAGYIDLKSREAMMSANENFGKIHINANIASKNINDSSSGDMTGHASGIFDSPTGHWAMVGEHGPEPMFVPKHATILPHGSTSYPSATNSYPSSAYQHSGGGGASNMAALIAAAQIIGDKVAAALLEHKTLVAVDGNVLGQAVVQTMKMRKGIRG